jgi:polar amino acid transport system substrate-binding protein
MNARRAAAGALVAIVVAACLPQQSQPTPAPTRTASDRPRFELATYMYALQTKGKIRIGALDKAAPLAVRDASGVYSGFEIDLGRELAKAIFGPRQDIDSVIVWISVDRSTAISALTSAQADVVIAGLVVQGAGAANDPLVEGPVALTGAYLVTGTRVLVKSSNGEINDLADLETRTVCVERGSVVVQQVLAANPFARTLELDTYASCLGALQRGQVDAIGAEEAVLWDLMKQDPATKLVGQRLAEYGYGIGTKKNDAGDRQGFLPFLDTWLAGAIRDGTWGRLYARHIAPYSHESRSAP